MRYLDGRRVLITGAAHGLGRALARGFAAAGAEVIGVDRDEAGLKDLQATCVDAGWRVEVLSCDLADRQAVAALPGRVHATAGRVTILVNNAGVVRGGRYQEVPAPGDEAILAVNVAAVHWLTKAFLPDLIHAAEGHLVLMASAAGLMGVPYQSLYCASKWFVTGLGEALRQELAAEGHRHVKVTVVAPSLVDTGMFAGARPPRWTPLLDTEAFARRVLDGIRRDERHIREPFMVKLAPALQALLPAPVTDRLIRSLGVAGVMAGFTNPPDAPPGA